MRWILQDAWLLYALVPAFIAWLVFWVWRRRSRRSAAAGYASLAPIRDLAPSRWQRLRPWAEGLRALVLALLVVAMARPQLGRQQLPEPTEGVAIMLALDTSGSMRALDLDEHKPLPRRRTRMEVVRDVVAKFVDDRPMDQMGMVVFGSHAYIQCPLTGDRALLQRFLRRLSVGMAGRNTAIGEALATAVKRLDGVDAESKVVVLLTDGVHNTGAISPLRAAEIAQALNVKVYTIGAGSRGTAPIREDHPLLGTQYVEQPVEIDTDTLKAIADSTGGAYFRAEDADALRRVYARIDELETSEMPQPRFQAYAEGYPTWVGIALAVLAIELVLLATRLRKLP